LGWPGVDGPVLTAATSEDAMSTIYITSRRRHVSIGRPTDPPDVDEVVVERLLAGDSQRLRPNWWELDAAIVSLLTSGNTPIAVAMRLGITTETVYRHGVRRRQLMEGMS
jgi:hypothetical protein